MSPPISPTTTSSYVTLGVGDETFAVDVGLVHEILDYRAVAHLPNAPAFLVGVIDVRGRTVPVVDLRSKLGFPPAPVTDQSRILVLELGVDGRRLVIGLLADRVFEVAEFETSGLESAPDVGLHWKSDYIRAIGRLRGTFVIIFDMEHLFGSDDVARLQVAP